MSSSKTPDSWTNTKEFILQDRLSALPVIISLGREMGGKVVASCCIDSDRKSHSLSQILAWIAVQFRVSLPKDLFTNRPDQGLSGKGSNSQMSSGTNGLSLVSQYWWPSIPLALCKMEFTLCSTLNTSNYAMKLKLKAMHVSQRFTQ